MDEERKTSHGGAVIFATVAASLVCYVLSMGPAIWLMDHDYLPMYLVMYVYMPIDMLATAFTPLGRALSWYLSLWQGVMQP